MPISIKKSTEKDLTVFEAAGPLTFQEQIAVLKEFYETSPTSLALWDLRKVSGTRISSKELEQIILFIKAHGRKRPFGKTALVSATDLDFGMSRMGDQFAEAENLSWQIRSFRTLEEAETWLNDRESS